MCRMLATQNMEGKHMCDCYCTARQWPWMQDAAGEVGRSGGEKRGAMLALQAVTRMNCKRGSRWYHRAGRQCIRARNTVGQAGPWRGDQKQGHPSPSCLEVVKHEHSPNAHTLRHTAKTLDTRMSGAVLREEERGESCVNTSRVADALTTEHDNPPRGV